MTWLTRQLRETCTYWGPPQADSWGSLTYPSPATMSCHWEERSELFIDKTGSESHSHAVILLAAEVQVDGRLYYGESSETNPYNQAGSDVIRKVERVPTIRGDIVTYKAIL